MVKVGRLGWVLLIAGSAALPACGGSSVRRDGGGGNGTIGRTGGTGGTEVGGTSVGGTGVGGTGVGGTAGDRSTGCERPLPDAAAVGCDYLAALGAQGLRGYCNKGGCHNPTTRAGDLDLTADVFLAARLLDVPAKHRITCGISPCDLDAPTCEACSQCAEGDLLIDTADPASSWILRTMNPFVPGTTTSTLSLGCGDAMPTFNSPGIGEYSQAHKDCLTQFFLALASTPGDWPCSN